MPPASTTRAPLLIVTVALAAAGCGLGCPWGSDHGRARDRSHTASKRAAPAGLRLTIRLLRSSRRPGLHAIAGPMVIHDLVVWAGDSGMPDYDAKLAGRRLTRLRFLAGCEDLFDQDPATAQVVSVVERYRSPRSARSELAHEFARVRAAPGRVVARFTVRVIPEAGDDDIVIAGSVTHAVAFTGGPFYCLISASAARGERVAPIRQQVISAATALYRRVRPSGEA